MIAAPPLKYRPDIDGLRSLAVIPVVLFHAGVAGMSGGFVGVDVFFVISGYLITSILLKSLAEDRFSITDFYRRRIKRIFPALLIVIVSTLAAGLVILPPDRLAELARASAASILFVSNFHFWKSVDYFATNTHVEPLLHTWSLAVEEQFYIFYPWLLFVAVRFGWSLRIVMAGVLGGSLALSVVALEIAPGAAFYLLPSRAWELALGGILALDWIASPRNRSVANAAGAAGVTLILFAIVAYDNATPFPGVAAVVPTLGTALIIWSGAYSDSAVARLLARPFPVLIGRASYSFYLWHLPLFAFATYLCGEILPLDVGLSLSAVALLLALVTLRLIEDPVRHSRSAGAYLIPSALMAGLLVLSFGIMGLQGVPQRFSPTVATILATAEDKNRHHAECMTSGETIVPPEKPCLLGTAGVAPSVLLWGDSHAMVTATAMEAAALRARRSFWFVAAADCPPGMDLRISENFTATLTRTPAYRFCDDYNRRMLKLALSRPDITTVVISSRWSNWRLGQPASPAEGNPDIRLESGGRIARDGKENAAIFRREFLALIDALRDGGKRVYVVGPVPEPTFDVPQRLYIARFGAVDPAEPIAAEEFASRHAVALDLMEEAVRKGAALIRPEAVLCSDGICPIERGGMPMFFDHNHLSLQGARMTAPLYRPIFQ